MAVIIGKAIEAKIHGYELPSTILFPSKKVIDVCNEISDSWIKVENPIIYLKTPREIKTNARRFMDSKFKLHKIFYKNILFSLDLKILNRLDNIDTCLKINNGLGLYISPYLLPTSFTAQDETGCMVVENIAYIKDDYYFEHMKPSLKKIILQQNVSEITESSYVHELTHTQLLDRKGIVRELCNSEVLSIFLELLNIFESKSIMLTKINDAIRFSELINDLNVLDFLRTDDIDLTEDEILSNITYATSIAKAYSLLIEYINGTPALRKYILRCIQNIFDGNLQLEELLDELEITFDSCFEDQKLLKYFCH